MNPYEMIGRQVVGEYAQELVGEAGFDWSTLINAAAEAANKGVQYSEQKKVQQKATASSAQALASSIAADAAWASAEQQLDLATQSDDATRIEPATALASQAAAASISAGSGLSADAQGKRLAAAQKAAKDAAQAALSSPVPAKGTTPSPAAAAKAAASRAWQKVLASVSAAGAGGGDGGGGGGALSLRGHKGGEGGGSWFTSVHAGLPTYAWIGGGAVAATALILIIRALRK